MDAATPHRVRGLALILEHCARVPDEPRTPASSRLEQRAGRDLARMLLKSLAREHRASTRTV
jgi:hypothetical protein